jgi:2-polyprenyl-3-methyl-5-hydroxy-6-metoxy-1,4-benzoquinol methylase
MNEYLEKFIKGMKVGSCLDLGCGKGYDMACMAQNGWAASGVDLPTDLNEPYEQEGVDLVYSIAVLQEIKNKDVFADTCYKNLKVGGNLFIITFSNEDKQFKKTGFSIPELESLFAKFDSIKITQTKFFDNKINGKGHWHRVLQLTGKKGV